MGADASHAGFGLRAAAIASLILLTGFSVYGFTGDPAGEEASTETGPDTPPHVPPIRSRPRGCRQSRPTRSSPLRDRMTGSRGPVSHRRARRWVVVPGDAPTEVSVITSGPDQPVLCEGPTTRKLAENGVVGTVRLSDGSPAEGAIVSGSKAVAVTGSDGDTFLLPRPEEPCSLRARHAPGPAAQSPPREIDPLDEDDQVEDFLVVPLSSQPREWRSPATKPARSG